MPFNLGPSLQPDGGASYISFIPRLIVLIDISEKAQRAPSTDPYIIVARSHAVLYLMLQEDVNI